MKLLFLDIDGVLNSYRTYFTLGSGDPSFLLSADNPRLDPIAIALLKRVVDTLDFKIVLSSSWRVGYNDQEIINMWKIGMSTHYGWKVPELFPIIGATQQDDFNASRGQDIQNYLDNSSEVESYIILDDDPDMLTKQLPHFYRCKTTVGLDAQFHDWIEDKYHISLGRIRP
jgi:hypothetical protein